MVDHTISKDLFLSILAMDAYNRGYGAGIALFGPIAADVRQSVCKLIQISARDSTERNSTGTRRRKHH